MTCLPRSSCSSLARVVFVKYIDFWFFLYLSELRGTQRSAREPGTGLQRATASPATAATAWWGDGTHVFGAVCDATSSPLFGSLKTYTCLTSSSSKKSMIAFLRKTGQSASEQSRKTVSFAGQICMTSECGERSVVAAQRGRRSERLPPQVTAHTVGGREKPAFYSPPPVHSV
eukprot:COSAG02_NODE_5827_length_4009_cov_19.149105_5_plen_173_part_00